MLLVGPLLGTALLLSRLVLTALMLLAALMLAALVLLAALMLTTLMLLAALVFTALMLLAALVLAALLLLARARIGLLAGVLVWVVRHLPESSKEIGKCPQAINAMKSKEFAAARETIHDPRTVLP